MTAKRMDKELNNRKRKRERGEGERDKEREQGRHEKTQTTQPAPTCLPACGQRAGIAAALAHDPDVLVLDEPTVGLDPKQRWRLRDLITELGTTRTVVVSTHLLDDVKTMCQRVGVLAAGRLVFDGTVTELEMLHDGPDTDGRRSPIERGYEQLLATAGADE